MFTTPGNLTIDFDKVHCDPKWRAGTAQDVQFCILSNVIFVFIKNSATQHVIDDVKDGKDKWIRPGGSNGDSLMIRIYNKNAHIT